MIKEIHFKKINTKISIFSFGYSDRVWVDAEKVMKKLVLTLDTRFVNIQIAKIK